ncbi:hypothetical protein SCHPADRAFT_898398 [Schizopora paradoxa]|uniref:Arginyl-tRNA--protein transferase 1 n=1 Tax=Schizopora paradoxa TaxID=27342 RepID=A0A0H2SRT5_9AGAM|nr:hypothetical protein SCHPADRAFT_898398 [Schizopora paradoxa]
MNEKPVLIYPEGYHASTCGYCSPPGQRSSEKSSFTVGISPVQLTCSYYQKMIDRGWRRSGEYCYKPDLHRSCCPQYTIRLNVNEFTPTRSQRKVVHRWNRFVVSDSENGDAMETDNKPSTLKRKNPPKSEPFSLLPSIHASEASFVKDQTPSHEFEVTLEPASYTDEKFELYVKYQADVHNDHRESESGFTRFLVDSPLEPSPIPYTTDPPEYLPRNYGSYHQMYRLDGKLIAMAIIDILPSCVSSVYFMYDTTWERFSLGKLSAMREASLAKEIQSFGVSEMKYLYMGFYIPSCKKMRYKGDYSPSFLLDPEEYSWHALTPAIPMLDEHRYVSFAHPDHSLKGNEVPATSEEPRISDEEASSIWTLHNGTDLQLLKSSLYWKHPVLSDALVRAIDGLGIELSRQTVFLF